MPTDSLQLYHPLSLQSLPNSASDYGGTPRHILGLPSRSSYGGNDFAPSRLGMSYVTGHGGPHSAGVTTSNHYLSSGAPLSAPPTIPPNPFLSHNHHNHTAYSQPHHQGYGTSRVSNQNGHSRDLQSMSSFYPEEQSHGNSTPGSGYQTPQ